MGRRIDEAGREVEGNGRGDVEPWEKREFWQVKGE